MNEEQRRRIADRTGAIVATFIAEYIRAYKDALIAKIKKEYQREPKEPKQLLTPPVRWALWVLPFRVFRRKFPCLSLMPVVGAHGTPEDRLPGEAGRCHQELEEALLRRVPRLFDRLPREAWSM
jgi:hypothetical protein